MSYKGDIRAGDTVDFKFTTRRFSTGAPFSLSAGDVIALIGNSSATVSAGITLTSNFGGFAGLNHVRWVASGANGYSASTEVMLVMKAGNIDGVSISGEVIAEYSIEKRSALMPTTGGRTLDVTATGGAGIDWANVENPTTALNLSGTNIDVDQVVASVSGAVASVTGAVGSVTGNVGGNVVGSVASVAGAVGSVTGLTASDVGAIKTQTDKFVFTVANQVDANIQSVNDVTVLGDGGATPWGP